MGRLLKNVRDGLTNSTTSYTYNVRDWMTGMIDNLYVQTLIYSYSDNIDEQQWMQDSCHRKYAYTCNNPNRLKTVVYTGDAATVPATVQAQRMNIPTTIM